MPTTMTATCYFTEKGEVCTERCVYCKGAGEYTYTYEACGVDGCTYNAYGMSPSHEASRNCKSGQLSHCTCDTCF